MPNKNKAVITKQGFELMARLIGTGSKLAFTKLCTSDHSYEETQLENLEQIENIRQEMPVGKVEISDNGTIVIEGVVLNTQLLAGYDVRLLGVFAHDPEKDVGILFAASIDNKPSHMPEYNGVVSSGLVARVVVVASHTNVISVAVPPAGLTTTIEVQKMLAEFKGELETGAVVVGKAKDSEKLGGQLPAWYMPTGAIMPFAGTTAPAGFLMCNGHLVSRIDYANLFAVCGTLYGTGNGSTTFNLPNMGGRFALGAGGGYSQGSVGGASTSTLTEQQLPSLIEPVKSHPSINAGVTVNEGNRPGWQLAMYNTSTCAYYDEMFVSFGGNQTHNNMPPYLALNYIIKT